MNAYDERPWLELYAHGVPHEIKPEHQSMLAVFEHTAARCPEKPALWYFDTTLSYGALRDLRAVSGSRSICRTSRSSRSR